MTATNENWISGEWTGFFLEKHHGKRAWMHLYLEFDPSGKPVGVIKGEGTDYVGPWNLHGWFQPDSTACEWTKQYVGKHRVHYAGQCGEKGIVGTWNIGSGWLTGPFHIWPRAWGDLDEAYLSEELRNSVPTEGRPRIHIGSGSDSVMKPAFAD